MNEISEEQQKKNVRLLVRGIAALAILYVSGWSIMWNGYAIDSDYAAYMLLSGQSFFAKTSAVLLEDHVFAIRINGGYYGVQIVSRFFDSPILSWLALGGATEVAGLMPKMPWHKQKPEDAS